MGDGMKILHLKDAFEQKYSRRDEVQVVSESILTGHNVTMITSCCDLDLKGQPRSYFETQDNLISGLETVRSKGLKLPFFWICIYLPPRNLFGEYDIIHAHNIGSYSSMLAYILKKVSNKPLVLKADFNQNFHNKLEKNFLRKLILKPAKTAEIVTAFTNYEKELLIDMGIQPDKIRVIPIGIDCKDFHNFSRRESSEVALGYMGRFVYEKGIHRIIEQLKKLMVEFPDIKIVFAGPKTDPEYAEKILDEMGKYSQFEYKGYINSPPEFYSEVDIVLVPSVWETGSIVALESMASGKAVVASNIIPHNEYIENGVSGFLAVDENDFYKYCRQLITDKAMRENIGKVAQVKVIEHDQSSTFAGLSQIYNQLTLKIK